MKIKKEVIMALSFGVLNLADYLTTRRILNTGGDEYNPVANFFVKKKCFGMFKTAAALAGMAAMYADEKPTVMGIALLGWYGVVVGHNVKEIVQHQWEAKLDNTE